MSYTAGFGKDIFAKGAAHSFDSSNRGAIKPAFRDMSVVLEPREMTFAHLDDAARKHAAGLMREAGCRRVMEFRTGGDA